MTSCCPSAAKKPQRPRFLVNAIGNSGWPDKVVIDKSGSNTVGLCHAFNARGEWSQDRASNLLDGGAPFYRCYHTKDDRFMSVGPLEPQFFAVVLEKASLPAEHGLEQNDPVT